MNKFYVYIHYSPEGLPFYVGKGQDNRFSPKIKRNSDHLARVLTYGIENISIEIIPVGSEDEAFAMEHTLIEKFRNQAAILCNRTIGGEGKSGWNHTPETKAKIAAAGTGRKLSDAHKAILLKLLVGHPYWPTKTPEARDRQINSRRGVKNTPEHNAKISASKMGHSVTEEQKEKQRQKMRGRKQSSEAKARQIAAQRGKKQSPDRIEKARLGLLQYFERKRAEKLLTKSN